MATSKRIVIVEDEADLADLVAYNLQKAGYETSVANDGRTGLSLIRESVPDLVVLDVMLPQLSGLDVARQVRTNPRTANTPIIMLTARATEGDQLGGLGAGADDYVTKPFSVKVLVARVQALLRRTPGGEIEPEKVVLSEVEADLSTHTLRVKGQEVKTTLTEFRLLVALMRSRGRTLTRYDLMSRAMGPGVMVTTRTIDVHIAAIRKKLGDYNGLIRTVRGVGYLMSEVGGGSDGDGQSGE